MRKQIPSSNYETVEAIWVNDIPIKMYDKWREYRDGIKAGCGCEVGMYDVESFFPTERDLHPCGTCSSVKMMVEDPADVGKVATIRYKDGNKQDMQDEIVLDQSYVCTERPVLFIEPRGGIVLPPDLNGAVIIADGNGRVLSRYAPWESVPSYRRVKLEGVCRGEQVYVKASRRFHELWFDDDVIETDNRLAIEATARYFRYNDSPSGDIVYQQKAAMHAADAKYYLLGEKSRHRGKATVSNVNVSQGRKTNSGLRSRRRSMGSH